jgi:hypothetical protein
MTRDRENESHRRSDIDSDRRHKRQRTRSRSPVRDQQDSRLRRQRSRSHERVHKQHNNRYAGGKEYELIPASAVPASPARPKTLAFKSKILDSHKDFDAYRPLFALYLSVQKQREISELDEREVKGRWKSFVKKWNKGELAEGWYDPGVKQRADAEDEEEVRKEHKKPRHRDEETVSQLEDPNQHSGPAGDLSDDEFGPSFPSSNQLTRHQPPKAGDAHGPTIPSIQDLTLRAEDAASESRANHLASRSALNSTRKAESSLRKSRADELAPRAEAHSHARRVENARDRAAVQSSFKSAREGGDVELNDGELLGGGDVEGGLEEFKQKRKEDERKKTERQIRREEMERARNEERRERLRSRQEKEDKTVEMLRELARARFGS